MMNHIYNSFMLMPGKDCAEIAGFIPGAAATAVTFPVFRIIIEFKKSVRRKHWPALHIRITGIGSGLLPFELEVVRATGMRIAGEVQSRPIIYSFCIDERIYYRRLISRPSLGLSPPLL
jgi:hypothetical protein